MSVTGSFVVCALLLIGAQAQSCTLNSIHECTDHIVGLVSADQIPNYTVEQLNEYCTGLNQYHSCINRIESSCSSHNRATLQGIKDRTTYLCSEQGRVSTLNHSVCFRENTVQLHRSVKDCSTTYSEAVQENPRDTCRLTNDFISGCIGKTVNRFCGSEASSYQQNLLLITWKPYYRHTRNCELQGSGAPTQRSSLFALIVAMAVILSMKTHSE